MLTEEMVNRGIEFCPEKMESYHPYWTVKPKKAEELHMTKSQKTSALNSLSNAVRALAMCLYGYSNTKWPLARMTDGRFIFWNFEPPRAF